MSSRRFAGNMAIVARRPAHDDKAISAFAAKREHIVRRLGSAAAHFCNGEVWFEGGELIGQGATNAEAGR